MGKGKNEGKKASGRMTALDDWLGEPAARFARWLASAPDISAAGLAARDEPNAFLECAGQRFGDLASCADPGRALRELDRLLAEVTRGAMGGPAEAQEAWEKARVSAREGAADPVDGEQKQRLFAGIEAAHLAQELNKELVQGIPARSMRPGL